MVGYTGVYSAAVEAVGTTDKAIGIVYEVCKKHGYALSLLLTTGMSRSCSTRRVSQRILILPIRCPLSWQIIPRDSRARYTRRCCPHSFGGGGIALARACDWAEFFGERWRVRYCLNMKTKGGGLG